MHWAAAVEQLGLGKVGLQLDVVGDKRVGAFLLFDVIPQSGDTVEHGCPMCAADTAST